jgi:hypothetical protein
VRGYHPRKGDFFLLKASWCQQEKSYISLAIVKRWNLYSYMANCGKIRLTWENQNPGEELPKTNCTVFQVIDDGKVKHDIAIGSAWSDEKANVIEEEEEDEHVDVPDPDNHSDERDDSDGYIHIDEDHELGLEPSHMFRKLIQLGVTGTSILTVTSSWHTRTCVQCWVI